MNFLLDVHIPRSLADAISNRGHQVELVVDLIDPSSNDIAILDLARKMDAVIITHDLDFGTLLAFSGDRNPSVVIFRIEKINAIVFETEFVRHWEVIEEPLQTGAIVIVEPASIRIRKLPIK